MTQLKIESKLRKIYNPQIMRYELGNQSIGLVDIFKKEEIPVAQSAGSGRKPPRIITSIAMEDPEPNKTPIPFAFFDAVENDGNLKWRNDDSYDLIMEGKLFWAFNSINPQELPGLDDILTEYEYLILGDTPPPTKEGLDRFLLSLYDAGQIKPQNWKQRLLQPVEFALRRHRVTSGRRNK